jgi:hypothetical protein
VYVPSSELGPPTLSAPKRVCPPEPKGGDIFASGLGGPNSDDKKKPKGNEIYLVRI